MKPDATYAAYVAADGKLPEDRFDAALPGARAAVDEAIWPNQVTDETASAYLDTVFAVLELIDSPPVAEERVGGTSIKYAGAMFSTKWDVPTIAGTIRTRLSGSGLLYRGI